MEKFIEALITVVKPPWSYILGVAALLIVVVPRLIELRQNFMDVQMGRRRLELEKLRLEVLKLQIDLKQFGRQQESPEVARELEAIAVSPHLAPTPTKRGIEPLKGLKGLLGRHPRLGRIIMLITQILMAYLMAMFAVSTVVVPVVFWSDANFGPAQSIGVAIVYAALAWLSYKGFAASRAIRKELVAH